MQRQDQHAKSLIRPLRQIKEQNIKNMFAVTSNNPETFQPMEMHHIVGESNWKTLTYGQILSKTKMSRLKRELSHNAHVNIDQPSLLNKDDGFGMMSTQKSKLTNFCLDQVDNQSRQKRTLQKFSQTRKMWKKTENSILQKVNKNKSLSFNAVKNIYLHPNPQKLSLINDNIPQYWKNSLRDNTKYLKKHLQGHPYRKEIAQEMLQTLGGRRKIEKSIPPIAKLCDQVALKGRNMGRKSESEKNSNYLEETLKSNYSCKDKWINEISCTQTLSSKFNFN